MSQLPDWEAVYAGKPLHPTITEVPWHIGEPQPAIRALIDGGRVRGAVLDAGCGIGETALYLAERGYPVVGLDLSRTAIERARRRAAERGLDAEFAVADVTELTGYDGRFDTVIDSTLFHSLPVAGRPGYLRSIARAARHGALLYALVLSNEVRFPEGDQPNAVDEAELRAAMAPHWAVDAVRRSTVAVHLPDEAAAGADRDGAGRALLPAYLLTARRPGEGDRPGS